MKVWFTPRAFADRAAIFDYLSVRSPDGARNVVKQLRHAIDILSSQPLSGHKTDVDNVRVLFLGRYPYKIFYRVSEDTIEILHIRHTSRRPSEIE
jgi:toxin ParE1/3/4